MYGVCLEDLHGMIIIIGDPSIPTCPDPLIGCSLMILLRRELGMMNLPPEHGGCQHSTAMLRRVDNLVFRTGPTRTRSD
jgi:hypothetical protein